MSGLGRRSHYRKHLTEEILSGFPEPEDGDCIARVVCSRGGNIIEVDVSSDDLDDEGLAVVCVASDEVGVEDTSGDAKVGTDRAEEEGVAVVSSVDVEEVEKSEGEEKKKDTDYLSCLALLPTKFKKLIYVKRGDFVIVSGSSGTVQTRGEQGEGKVRFMVKHILFQDQIRHLKSLEGVWPSCFEGEGVDIVGGDSGDGSGPSKEASTSSHQVVSNDGITYSTDDYGVPDTYNQNSEDEDGVTGEDNDPLFVNTNRLAALRMHEDESDDSSDDEEE